MVSKKAIMDAPYVVKHEKSVESFPLFHGPVDDVLKNIEALRTQYGSTLSFDFDFYDSHMVVLRWDEPMTETQKATELKRRELQCQQMDLRRNRKKLVEKIKSEPDTKKALEQLLTDPELAKELLGRL